MDTHLHDPDAADVCTSKTRPTDPPYGTCIYESDTRKVRCYTGTDWVDVDYDPSEVNVPLHSFALDTAQLIAHLDGREVVLPDDSSVSIELHSGSVEAGVYSVTLTLLVDSLTVGENIVDPSIPRHPLMTAGPSLADAVREALRKARHAA